MVRNKTYNAMRNELEGKIQDMSREMKKKDGYIDYLRDQNDQYCRTIGSVHDKKETEGPAKIYISGAITNDPDYKTKFKAKAKELKKAGYIVLTPLFIDAELTWNEYMQIDLAMIDVCDEIYMLKGWQKSKGAMKEQIYASIHNKKITYEELV